jgi:hypothetical protein
MKLSCSHCAKEYTKKSSLVKHQLLCEFLHRTKREKQIDNEESNDLPSYTELVYIVQELAYKNSQVEKKLAELENQAAMQYKKRKINVDEWLNQNVNPPYTYAEMLSHLNIGPDHVKMLFEMKLIPIICNILETDLVKSACPVYCVKNTLYCYKDEATKWVELDKKGLVQLLNNIHQKVLTELCSWRANNLDKLDTNDKLSISYNQSMIKLMDVDFNQDVNLNKIKMQLSNHLRCELKSVIEYEFE